MGWISQKRRICLVHCHPNKGSFNASLAAAYASGAQAGGHHLERFNLYDMSFDPVIRPANDELPQALETDLAELKDAIGSSDHLVLVFPLWWFGTPSLLKGALERLLTPGWAFRFKGPLFWDKLMAGKSARVIYTMDAPPLIAKCLVGDPIREALKTGTLAFVGFEPVNITAIGPVKLSTHFLRECWKARVERLGRSGA